MIPWREINVSHTAEPHLEPSQTCMIEPFVEMVSGLDVWLGSKYAPASI